MKIKIDRQSETEKIASQLAAHVQLGDVIALHGDLGVGKSVFARAFIRSLTSIDEEVPSPTFTLVQIYEAEAGELYHFDVYRLEQADEALELGIEEAFNEGISLIEWPERAGALLPKMRLDVTLAFGESDETRVVRIERLGNWNGRLNEL